MRSSKKITAAIAAVTVIVLGAGVAYAAYTARAGVGGSSKNAQFLAQWGGTPSTATGTTATPPTTAPSITNNRLSIGSGGEFFPGDVLTISGLTLKVTGTRVGQYVGLDMTGLPTGYTATLSGLACGASIDPAGSAKTVSLVITATDNAVADGAAFTLDPLAAVKVNALPKGVITGPAMAATACDFVA